MSIEKRAFRDAMGCFATGICVASAFAADGKPVGVTVNSFSSVSLDPPLVLFCIDRKAESAPAFQQAAGFALSILAEDQKEISANFAVAPMATRWDGMPMAIWESGAPVLTGGLATLDCALHAVHDGGDHLIIVGRVLRLESRQGSPLLYYRGAYTTLV